VTRRTRIGALAWASIIQYFVVLLVVRSAWDLPYSSLTYAISDLGAVSCGEFSGRQVCSPWHLTANISWTITGATLAAGAVLLRPVLPRRRTALAGVVLLVLSGLGELSVGLHPEDAGPVHVPSAVIAIGCGLPGILLVGWSLRRLDGWRAIGWAGVAMGAIGLLAVAVLFGFPGHAFGLFERIAAYPILLWCLACGVWVLRPRPQE
jgi:hypothetical membrane protein